MLPACGTRSESRQAIHWSAHDQSAPMKNEGVEEARRAYIEEAVGAYVGKAVGVYVGKAV